MIDARTLAAAQARRRRAHDDMLLLYYPIGLARGFRTVVQVFWDAFTPALQQATEALEMLQGVFGEDDPEDWPAIAWVEQEWDRINAEPTA